MAKVELARGGDSVIRRGTGLAGGVDGKIYISTDRYKLYTDISNTKRVELNQGIVLETTIDFEANAETTSVNLKEQIGELNLGDSNFMIMVCGKEEDYYDLEVSCINAEGQTLTFTIVTPTTEKTSFSVSVFIYDGVAGLRNFNVTQRDETPTIEIDPSGWVEAENGYAYRMTNPNLTEDSLVMFGTNNDVSGSAYLTGATTTDGALIINSSVKPVETIDLYVQQLPAGSQSNNLTITPENWVQEGDLYWYEYTDINTQESTILIQCLNNSEEFQSVTYGVENSTIDFWSTEIPNEPIELQIILIPNDTVVNIEATLLGSGWAQVAEDSLYYTNSISLETPLTCGGPDKDYSSAPIVTCVENEQGYAMITKINIQEDRKTIQCIANNLPSKDIKINFTDFLA